MAKSKQRTVTGAYSEQSFGDNGPDRIRSADWGCYEGNSTPPVRALDADYLVDKQNFSGPAKFPKAKTQTKDWQ
jgi:hypothetical protein